ncbi:hypothetical protein QM012_003969 [Aureobasidium pullulans]|uniref:Mitochondrial pyruvate carrier n=1 Tax=Aureobasidium pullulans TaxID=5580 RepID=A0ABR0T8A4_AURPU
MAAAIKALNAKIRSNPYTDYICSTHFWGPASNFGIPLAAVMDTQKDPEIISGSMTLALCGYSATFMRYAMAVTPVNYLLFGCHFVNFGAQATQAYRYLNYWKYVLNTLSAYVAARVNADTYPSSFGGKELRDKANQEASHIADQTKAAASKVESKAKEVANKVTSS